MLTCEFDNYNDRMRFHRMRIDEREKPGDMQLKPICLPKDVMGADVL